MPSLPYQIKPGDALDVAFWQGVFDDLQTRLASLEATAGDWDAALADKSTALAEGLLTDSVSPQISQLQDEIQTLRNEINAAEDQLNALLSAGIVGTSVSVTVDGLNATNAQAALAELKANADALAQTVSDVANSIPQAASLQDAEAGSGSGYLTASLGAAQIAALAGKIVKEVFTTSGTFTKQADDLAYFVEAWGGGGGGGAYNGGGSSGGGGGEYVAFLFQASEVASDTSVTVGGGGFGTANAAGFGGDGGSSSFGALLTALGGIGGANGNTSFMHPGMPGSITPRSRDDEFRMVASSLVFPQAGFALNDSLGGSAIYGGAGGGGGDSSAIRSGGTSKFGGDGGTGGGNGTTPTEGQAPGGGGGGGGYSPIAGANGARGEVRVWRIKRAGA